MFKHLSGIINCRGMSREETNERIGKTENYYIKCSTNIVRKQNRNVAGSKGKSGQKSFETNIGTFVRIMNYKPKPHENEQYRNEVPKINKK